MLTFFSYLNSKNALIREVGDIFLEIARNIILSVARNNDTQSAKQSARYLMMLPHEMSRVNAVVQFSKEVNWQDWEELYAKALRMTNSVN